MKTLSLSAPAKVNLSLRILGKRPDGYHLLNSLATPISLFDEVRLEVLPPGQSSAVELILDGDVDGIPADSQNLVCRAASMFLEAVGNSRKPVRIGLTKRIPAGAGLGGGSSDAASVLLGLNELFDKPFSPSELASMGLKLGADIPFFLGRAPARMEGIGEILTPIVPGPDLSLVVAWDRTPLSTREVYSAYSFTLTTKSVDSNIAPLASDVGSIPSSLVNDLETTAATLHPGVLFLKKKLAQEGATAALMSGSGSAVFGIWQDDEAAQAAAEHLRELGIWAVAVRTLANAGDSGSL